MHLLVRHLLIEFGDSIGTGTMHFLRSPRLAHIPPPKRLYADRGADRHRDPHDLCDHARRWHSISSTTAPPATATPEAARVVVDDYVNYLLSDSLAAPAATAAGTDLDGDSIADGDAVCTSIRGAGGPDDHSR